MKYGDCEKADSMLTVIETSLTRPLLGNRLDSLERVSKKTFLATQRIGLRYHCDSIYTHLDSTFVFEQYEIDTLRVHARKPVAEAAYARTLLFIATGETSPDDWVMPNGVYLSPLPLEINEIDINNFVELYPNPAKDAIYISYTGEEDLIGELTIKDMLGKVVLKKVVDLKHNSKLSIDVLSYNNGIYFLSIEDKDKGIMKTQKFVINHNK